MASAHSFTITLANNKTESEGLEIVLGASRDLFVPDKHGRKQLLKHLDLDKKFLRAFDLVRIAGANAERNTLPISDPKDITLIELKTTKKRLPDNPYGFFFGVTENEFNLAKQMGSRFIFAFVCLHPDCPSVKFLTFNELQSLIQLQRTQFQVSLRRSERQTGR